LSTPSLSFDSFPPDLLALPLETLLENALVRHFLHAVRGVHLQPHARGERVLRLLVDLRVEFEPDVLVLVGLSQLLVEFLVLRVVVRVNRFPLFPRGNKGKEEVLGLLVEVVFVFLLALFVKLFEKAMLLGSS